MEVSIIIPTYNGAKKIITLLKALEQQTFKEFEVIVIVDGSTDNTVELLKSKKFNFKSFKIIEQKNQGRAKVRNNGAKITGGNLLIYFDDDMQPSLNCVFMHVQHHLQNPASILTGAQIDNQNQTDIQKYKAYLSLKWSEPLIKSSSNPLVKENMFLTAANFSIPKNIFFNELDGFDEQLTDAEDYDLAVRAFQKNIPLYYNHQAFSFHNDAITCKSYIVRLRQYGVMQKKLATLKPKLYDNFTMRTGKIPKGIKSFIFKLFTFKYWIWSVDNFNWLKIFPKKIRYKMYDLIITSNGVFYPDRVKF